MLPALDATLFNGSQLPVVSYQAGGSGLTLTRGSTAFALDDYQRWQSFGANVSRPIANVYSNYVGGYVRAALVEASDKNLVIQSDALATTWTAVGSPTVANAAATAANRPFSSIAFATGWGTDYVKQAITFTGNAVKGLSLLFKQSGSAAGTFTVQLYDGTAAAAVMAATVTVAADGTMTCSTGTGTQQEFRAEADGVYRLKVQATSVTAAHTNEIRVGTGGTVTAILVSGVMAVDNVIASSLYPTTSAAATRSADLASLSFAGTPIAVPQSMTLYSRFIETGTTLLAASNRILQLGSGTNSNSNVAILSSGGHYRVQIANGSTSAAASLASSAALGDQVEHRVYVSASGAATIEESINGAASTSTSTTAVAIPSAWSDTNLYFAQRDGGNNAGFGAFLAVRAYVGNVSMSDARARG